MLTPEEQKELDRLELRRLEAKRTAAMGAPKEDVGRGVARSLGQGALLGFGDEIAGLTTAAMAKLTGEERSFGDIYRETRDLEREGMDEFREERPGLAMGLELAGGLATGGVGMGRAAGSTALRRAASRVGTVAGESALAGAGAADENRLEGAATGAGLGLFTAGLMKGGGGLVKSVAKRRVKPKLERDGDFLPIPLAQEKGAVGQFYRGIVGKTYGGDDLIKEQAAPHLGRVASRVKQAEDIKEMLPETLAREKRAIASEAADLVDEGAQNFRKTAGARILPDTAPEELRTAIPDMPPQKAAKAADKWWQKNGFAEQKKLQYDVDKLRKTLGDDFAEGFEGVVPGKALFKTRNDIARTANKMVDSDPYQAGLLREKVHTLDDAMRAQMDDDTARLFDEELATWGVKQNYVGAVDRATNKKQGMFNEDDWISSGWGRKKRYGEGPLQPEAAAGQVRRTGIKKAAKQAAESVGQGRKKAAKKGLKAAKAEQAKMQKLMPKDVDGLSKILTTGLLASPLTAITTLVGGPAGGLAGVAAGSQIGKMLASKSGQKFVAGQTDWQRRVATELRKKRNATRLVGRGIYRTAAQQGDN